MTNILTNPLPETVDINGAEYPINTDFRAGIRYEMIMQQEDEEAVIQGLILYYGENIPADIEEAVNAINWFRSRGREPKKLPGELAGNGKQAFSFECDAELVYADFMREYRIDLNTEDMHWWKFMTLFEGLQTNSRTTDRMGYRSMKTDKLPKEQKKYYQAMQRYYEIAQMQQDVLDELDDILLKGGDPEMILKKEGG